MNFSSYRSPKTENKKSHIDGTGLFAKETIDKDEIVLIRSGHIINGKAFKQNKEIINDADVQIADDFYLAPLSRKDYGKVMCFVNHSCIPNLGFMGNIICIAMRKIIEGEELTIDYAMYDNNDQKFNCKCKQKNCRKIITGKDWLRKDLQEEYGIISQVIFCKK